MRFAAWRKAHPYLNPRPNLNHYIACRRSSPVKLHWRQVSFFTSAYLKSRRCRLAYIAEGVTMAENGADHGFNPLSPHSSSGGPESLKGTPDTRLTTFSPEEGSGKSKRFLGLLRAASAKVQPLQFPVRPFAEGSTQGVEDPFVISAPPVGSRIQNLSPTAAAFQPVASTLAAHGPGDHPSPTRNSHWILSPGYRSSQPSPWITSPEPSGPSHCLTISARGLTQLSAAAIEHYITVRLRPSSPLGEPADVIAAPGGRAAQDGDCTCPGARL